MGLLDDTAVFAAVVQQGGFSHAAKFLGLSNGMVSRRIASLEATLGVTLLKRTTRQIQLTPEGELLWQHAQKIQLEMDSAVSLIQTLAEKPTGKLRVSAPVFFGRFYLMPIFINFLQNFPDIQLDLIISNERLDPLKEHFDLVIRGSGYLSKATLKDSSMKMKLLSVQKVGVYASSEYLAKYGEPRTAEELTKHVAIGILDTHAHFQEEQTWSFTYKNKPGSVNIVPRFCSNEIENILMMCVNGIGIAKVSALAYKHIENQTPIRQLLTDYDWGEVRLYALYSGQQPLPKRARILLDFISSSLQQVQGF